MPRCSGHRFGSRMNQQFFADFSYMPIDREYTDTSLAGYQFVGKSVNQHRKNFLFAKMQSA